MTKASVPANGYEQAEVHDSHIVALIHLIKKHFNGEITITQEDLIETAELGDCLQIRAVSPNVWTIGVGKSLEHERPGVSYMVYKQIEEPDAETISEA